MPLAPIVFMNQSDSDRLAQIRAQNEKWLAVEPEAVNWDTTFLLRLLDELRSGCGRRLASFGRLDIRYRFSNGPGDRIDRRASDRDNDVPRRRDNALY